MQAIRRSFPLPARTVQEDGAAIIFSFADNDGVCVDFRTQPDGRVVTAGHC